MNKRKNKDGNAMKLFSFTKFAEIIIGLKKFTYSMIDRSDLKEITPNIMSAVNSMEKKTFDEWNVKGIELRQVNDSIKNKEITTDLVAINIIKSPGKTPNPRDTINKNPAKYI